MADLGWGPTEPCSRAHALTLSLSPFGVAKNSLCMEPENLTWGPELLLAN